MKVDIRHLFHLGEYHDHVEINKNANGYINYKVHAGGYKCIRTRSFCNVLNVDDEFTMIWLLKYGDLLPRHVREL